MRWLALALTACATTTSRTSLDRFPAITQDKLVIVVDRVHTRTSRPLFSDPADLVDVDEDRTALGAAEIDLATGECVWHSGARERSKHPDVAGFTRAGNAVHVNGQPVDVPVFPLGSLVAIAPGKAVFDSPLGAIVFDHDSAGTPQRGVVPLRATTAWWHAKTPLVVGQTIYTPVGFAVRVDKDALDIQHARERRRIPLASTASLVYFDGTEFISTGDAVIDVAHDGSILRDVAVENVLQYDDEPLDGVYFQLRDGRVFHTSLPFKISDARPLAVRMNLIAIRGRRFVFDTGGMLFIFDGKWRWRSYEECLP